MLGFHVTAFYRSLNWFEIIIVSPPQAYHASCLRRVSSKVLLISVGNDKRCGGTCAVIYWITPVRHNATDAELPPMPLNVLSSPFNYITHVSRNTSKNKRGSFSWHGKQSKLWFTTVCIIKLIDELMDYSNNADSRYPIHYELHQYLL